MKSRLLHTILFDLELQGITVSFHVYKYLTFIMLKIFMKTMNVIEHDEAPLFVSAQPL